MTRTELLQKLKAKRKEFADREGLELFMVFTNKALEETVKAMPATREDLALVKGWGKTKIAKYGSEILEIITKHLETGRPSTPNTLGRPVSKLAVFSVGEFLEAVNITLSRLGTTRVRGEVSELQHRGKVVYFVLKDAEEEANIKCVLWAWKFEQEYNYLENGMEIIVDAFSEVYAKFGSFSLRVERVEAIGEGALQKAFEALKKKLDAKGYFDADRKRPLPYIIKNIGVITSEKGEAINDFRKNLGSFGFLITLMDARVEGAQAEESIIVALQYMNSNRPDLDVICLIRGGGGLENLKAFNSERVAHAVISSRIPVLTGIGHEGDQTIAGLSSDADYSTPTKVADAIRRSREEIARAVESFAEDIQRRTEQLMEKYIQSFLLLQKNLLIIPAGLLERVRIQITMDTHKLASALGRIFSAFHALERVYLRAVAEYSHYAQSLQHTLVTVSDKIKERTHKMVQTKNEQVLLANVMLQQLNPEEPLRRGYSIVYGKNGNVIKHAEDVMVGEQISTRLYDGTVTSKVISADDKLP